MKVKINGKLLVLARYKKGFDISMMAQETGLSRVCIYNAESGNKSISPVTLKKMCDALGISVEDVVTVEEQAG